MADKVYQLPYDSELDQDIHNWLEKLPRSRKAEFVRNAIRFYLQATGETPNPVVLATNVIQPVTQAKDEQSIKKKRPSLPKDGNL
ncbi:hypothetical protein [Niallia sp. 03190]|uniref:hypothetical protein n=1 Tax=Niallia sp. 03190 TaxID=3458061 RepID=UPI004043D21B